jgi:hypothetical protein
MSISTYYVWMAKYVGREMRQLRHLKNVDG